MARPSEVEIGALGVVAIGVIAALLRRRMGPDSARLPGGVVLTGRSTPFATPMQTRKETRLWRGFGLSDGAQRVVRSQRLVPKRWVNRPTKSTASESNPTVLSVGFDPLPHVKAARRLNRAAGVLATSVLADSAVEHYRGSFENKAMFIPLVTSALSLAVSGHGVGDKRSGAHAVRDAVYVMAALAGAVGTGFHIYNVTKRPSGFSWLNLFYGAPLGAPFALVLSGVLGFTAERVRDNPAGATPTLFGLPAGRTMAAMTGLGMLGTTGEAGLLHFRGAYHNPAMFLPVAVPPAAAALLGNTALGQRGTNRWFTRYWLRLTAALGFAGVGFHVFGVARNMGGWRNWRQNVLNGPPIPAPPSFTGLALAGLAALGLLEDHPDA